MNENRLDSRAFYGQLLKFFIPIAIMTIVMKSSQSIISAALTRTVAPAIAMTAFSVSNSISTLFMAPSWAILKVSVSTATDQESYKSLMTVGWWTYGIIMAIMLVVGFVPSVTYYVFVTLSGLNPDILPTVTLSYRVFLFMPIMGVFRTLANGFVTLQKKTYKLTIAVVLRVIYMIVMIQFLAKGQWLEGGVMGAFIFVSGFGVEALSTLWSARGYKKTLPPRPETGSGMSVRQIWIFFLPLIAAQLIGSFISPAINAGLARVNNPEVAISSFFVARSFAWMILGIGFRIHQIVVVFVKDALSWKRVNRFIIAFSLSVTILLLVIAYTPLGTWAFGSLIGVDTDSLAPVIQTLAVLALAPIFLFTAESYEGILLQHKNTMGITLAKSANIIGLVASLFLFSRLFPDAGAILGGVCMVASYVVEAIVAFILARPRMRSLLT